MGSAEDQPRRPRIRIPAIYLPREPARRGIAVPRAVRGVAFPARGVVSPPNGIGGRYVNRKTCSFQKYGQSMIFAIRQLVSQALPRSLKNAIIDIRDPISAFAYH